MANAFDKNTCLCKCSTEATWSCAKLPNNNPPALQNLATADITTGFAWPLSMTQRRNQVSGRWKKMPQFSKTPNRTTHKKRKKPVKMRRQFRKSSKRTYTFPQSKISRLCHEIIFQISARNATFLSPETAKKNKSRTIRALKVKCLWINAKQGFS